MQTIGLLATSEASNFNKLNQKKKKTTLKM